MEIGTRQLENIFEISDQIHAFDKDSMDVEAYFVHRRPFWDIPGHPKIILFHLCIFFVRVLLHPRVLFYDNLSANNFVYCF